MKKGILITLIVMSFLMVSSFMGSGVHADTHVDDMGMTGYGGLVYNFEVEEPGLKAGIQGQVAEGFEALGDITYYFVEGDASLMAFRGSVAYNLEAMMGEGNGLPGIKPLAGVGYYRFSVGDVSDSEFDFHVGVNVEEKVAEDISIRGDAIFNLGLTDMQSSFELGGGIGFTF